MDYLQSRQTRKLFWDVTLCQLCSTRCLEESSSQSNSPRCHHMYRCWVITFRITSLPRKHQYHNPRTAHILSRCMTQRFVQYSTVQNKDHAMAQVVSCHPLIAEIKVQSHANSHGICCH
jgi:hypothetical protein